MKWFPVLGCALPFLSPHAGAGPVEDAILAAMRLSEQANYSWVTTVTDDARTYEIFGRTVRGGYSRVKMPVINSLRRQLGRSVTDTQIEFIFRGNVACVVETEHGWRRPDELPLLPPEDPTAGASSATAGSRGSIVRPPPAPPARTDAPRAYSNLQLGLSHPHEDLGVIVASHESLTVEEGVVSGTLTDLGARLLLVRDGQEKITPLRAAGTFTLWLRGDAIVKYRLQLHGSLSVQLPGGPRTLEVNQVSVTTVTDAGTTSFTVPEEARARLGG